MVDKSNEYGYVGSSPTQAVGSNTGVFEVNDIIGLLADNQWSLQSSLILIETKDITGATYVDFTDLKNYDTHLLIVNNFIPSTATIEGIGARLSNNGGSSFISTGNHRFVHNYVGDTGTAGLSRGTTATSFPMGVYVNDEGTGGVFAYFYNLLDSGRYSTQSYHHYDWRGDGTYANESFHSYGGCVYPVAETHNAIRLLCTNNAISGDVSLYGIFRG